MSSVLTSRLSGEETRKALVRISHFVISEEIDTIRDDLQENIVEMALFWGTKDEEFVSKDEISGLIRAEIYLIDFPDPILDNILARLLKNGALDSNNGLYHLRGIERIEIQKRLEEKRKKIDHINNLFTDRLEQEYGKKLTKEQKQEGLEKFYSLLASLSMDKSDLAARIVTRKEIENLPTALNIHVFFGILATIGDLDLRNAEMRAIQTMFKDASEDFCSFLFSLIQNLVCIQVLNLDPQCQSLERVAFKNKALFLDTNILIALLCPTHWMNEVAKQCVVLSESLGAKCLVTKKTCLEYLHQLEEAKTIYESWQAPYRLFENADNEFLSSFWFEKNATSLSWEDYYNRMRKVEDLLKEQGIEYFVADFEKVKKAERFKEIRTRVGSCYHEIKGRHKTPIVCEHDALHLMLIRELRRKDRSALIGPNYWFITGDETLLCVDERINTLAYYQPDKTPSSMLSDIWLDMISPFLPSTLKEKDAYGAFSILIKHQFAVIPFAIDTDAFLKIQGSWTKYDWLDAKDIVRIQNKEWTKKYIKKVREAQRKGLPSSKIKGLAKTFANKLQEELEVIKDEKLNILKRELQNLSKQQGQLQATLDRQREELSEQQEFISNQGEQLEQRQTIIQSQNEEIRMETDFKKKMRVISAIAGMFLIFSPPSFVFAGVFPIDLATCAYCAGSFIVGAILLYFAIAYEKAKVSLQANLTPLK